VHSVRRGSEGGLNGGPCIRTRPDAGHAVQRGGHPRLAPQDAAAIGAPLEVRADRTRHAGLKPPEAEIE
jgi:hypothetical protein